MSTAGSTGPARPQRDWHDYLRSGWVIIGVSSMVVTGVFQVGRFVESVSRPPVKVKIPDELRAELQACRALAYVVERQRRRPREVAP